MLADKLRAATAAKALPVFVSSSVNRVNTNTNNVTAPADIQDGDLLVAVWAVTNKVTATLPTGFVRVINSSTTDTKPEGFIVATKLAASESGNYSFSLTTGETNTAAILVYRNATRVNTVGSENRQTTNSPSATAITPTFRGTLLAVFVAEFGRTVTSAPAGMTERANSGAVEPTLVVYDQSPQEAASTGSKSLSWNTSSGGISILLQITNESTVAPEFVASEFAQNTSSTTTQVVNKPAGTVEGDLMVAVMANVTAETWTGDTGWTEVAELGSNPRLRIAYKVAGASEPSSYTFTLSASSEEKSACILTYRYAAYDTIGSFTSGTNPLILPSISPSESQSILIAAGARDVSSVTLGTPTSMTARVTDATSRSPSFVVCDQTVAKGPTGTRSMSTGSTNRVAGIMLAIKPTRSL